MGHLASSIRDPENVEAIAKVKRLMRRRWHERFFACSAYTEVDTDQIVDDVVVDICNGKIPWDYGRLEAVLIPASHWRAIDAYAKAARRSEVAEVSGTPVEETNDRHFKFDGSKLWRSVLPSQDDVLIRVSVEKLCQGHEREAQLAQLVLECPGLLGEKRFYAQDIRDELEKRGTKLTIEDVRQTIERLKKLLKPLGSANSDASSSEGSLGTPY